MEKQIWGELDRWRETVLPLHNKMTVQAQTTPSDLNHLEKLVLFSGHSKFFTRTLKIVLLSVVNI